MLESEIFIQTHSIWQAMRQTFNTKNSYSYLSTFVLYSKSHIYEVAVLYISDCKPRSQPGLVSSSLDQPFILCSSTNVFYILISTLLYMMLVAQFDSIDKYIRNLLFWNHQCHSQWKLTENHPYINARYPALEIRRPWLPCSFSLSLTSLYLNFITWKKEIKISAYLSSVIVGLKKKSSWKDAEDLKRLMSL